MTAAPATPFLPEHLHDSIKALNKTVIEKAYIGDKKHDSEGNLSLLDEITAFRPSEHGTVVDFTLGEIQLLIWQAWSEGKTSKAVWDTMNPEKLVDTLKNGIIAEGGVGRAQLLKQGQLAAINFPLNPSNKKRRGFFDRLLHPGTQEAE